MVGRDTMQTMDKVYFMLEKVDEAFISNALEGVIIWSCSITSYGMGVILSIGNVIISFSDYNDQVII
jgi:hypothetical protein